MNDSVKITGGVSLLGIREEGVRDQCVTKELNTLLTALYVLVDDHVVPARVGRGRASLLSDNELITRVRGQQDWPWHFKLIEAAQARWRAVNASHLVALVRAGATFEGGKLVERTDEHPQPEAV